MDFRRDEDSATFEREVRNVLDEVLTPEVRARVKATGSSHDWTMHRAFAERGWLAAALPVELGGDGRSPDQMSTLFRELELADAPYDGLSITMLVAYVLGHIGTPEQKERFLGPMLRGERIPCLGYSESESGSDVAAAATTATRDGDDWIITGHKMFTSVAEEASWAFMLTRTNTEVAKHRGLTFFLVPMDDPNVEIRELRTLSDKRTNATFYDGVRVPDGNRIGEVDGGWDVMLVALAFERGVAGGLRDISVLYRHALDHFRRLRPDGSRPIDDGRVRATLARLAIDKEAADLLGDRAVWAAARGVPRQEGAEAKLFATEANQRAAAAVFDLLGVDALLTGDAADAPAGGVFERAYRFAPIATTAGGTSEIQKNLIAQRSLRLPRAR
jgi:alkylation response protein AidB-like acyl-CoA dehydrogenase